MVGGRHLDTLFAKEMHITLVFGQTCQISVMVPAICVCVCMCALCIDFGFHCKIFAKSFRLNETFPPKYYCVTWKMFYYDLYVCM